MNTSLVQTLKLSAMAALTAFAFTGCMSSSQNDPTTDGGNVVITQEANNMGAVLNGSASTTAKVSVTDDSIDPVTKEKLIVRLHYESVCQCFVRSAQFLNSKGFERQRVDSIWLDSSGQLLSLFRPGHADSIVHVRHITRINGNTGKEVNLDIRTTLTRKTMGDSVVFQWSGTITGSFNNTEFRSGTFSITRTFVEGQGFGPPEGVIDLQRDRFDIRIDFHGGEADCHVTRGDVEVRHTHVSVDGNET